MMNHSCWVIIKHHETSMNHDEPSTDHQCTRTYSNHHGFYHQIVWSKPPAGHGTAWVLCVCCFKDTLLGRSQGRTADATMLSRHWGHGRTAGVWWCFLIKWWKKVRYVSCCKRSGATWWATGNLQYRHYMLHMQQRWWCTFTWAAYIACWWHN